MSDPMIDDARTALADLAMKTPVAILTPALSRDVRGAQKEDFTAATLVTVNGRLMQPGAADRRVLDGQNIAGSAYVVGLPYGTVVTPRARLKVNGKTLSILNVDMDGTDILYVRCLCYLPGN